MTAPRHGKGKKGAAEEENKAIATDLFDKAVTKMGQGNCDREDPAVAAKPIDVGTCKEARELFKRAYELYPSALGALRNLAFTEKGLGMVASAARSFRELARKAPLDPKPERQKCQRAETNRAGEYKQSRSG